MKSPISSASLFPYPTAVRGCLGVLVASALLSTGVLTGCTKHNTHQIIGPVPNCVTCHDEAPATFHNVITPSSAVEVGDTVTVKTKYSAVYLCTPLYTAEDGSGFVPLIHDRIPTEDGVATITLKPGAWVLAVDNGETARCILVDSLPEIDKVKKLSL